MTIATRQPSNNFVKLVILTRETLRYMSSVEIDESLEVFALNMRRALDAYKYNTLDKEIDVLFEQAHTEMYPTVSREDLVFRLDGILQNYSSNGREINEAKQFLQILNNLCKSASGDEGQACLP